MDVEGCPLPDELLYDLDSSVWVRPGTEGGPATLGVIAAFAAFAGRFSSVKFRPPVDGTVASGRSIATVESVRLTGAVRLPVDGSVSERNHALEGRPRLLNDSPYGDGWVIRFRPADPTALSARLETAPAVGPRLLERVRQLRIRCYPAIPDLELYEIGAECSAILARVDDELARRDPDEVLLLVTDDPTSPIELVRWSDRTGHTVLHHRIEGTLHHFLLRKEADPRPRRRGG